MAGTCGPQLCFLLMLITISALISGDDSQCFLTYLIGSPARIELTNTPENATCYTFLLIGNEDVYITFKANFQRADVTRIIVSNLDGNQSYQASDRRFASDPSSSDAYVVVGQPITANVTEKTVNITVYVSKPYLSDRSVVIGSISNTTCSMSLDVMPNVIAAPDYQPGLPFVFNCSYDISPNDNGEVKEDLHLTDTLEFTQFSLSAGSELAIGAADKPEEFRGYDLPRDYLVNGTAFKVLMTINMAENDTFSAALARSTKECTREVVLDNPTDVISVHSLQYPVGPYFNNLNCKILVRSREPGSRVRLSLEDIELAKDRDSLVIIDGGASRNINGRVIAYLSAMDSYRHADAVMVSSGDTLMLKFVTDELGTAKGFNVSASLTDVDRLYLVPSVVSFAPVATQPRDANLVMLGEADYQIELTPNVPGGVKMTPASTVMCYDGNSPESPLIASYRKDLLMFPAYSTSHRMLCVANNFSVDNDFFNAVKRVVPRAQNKFSAAKSDFYTLDVPVGEAGEGNSTYNWIIQPQQYDMEVIELTISELEFPVGSASVTVEVRSLKDRLYADITPDTVLPYRLRASTASALRLSTSVTMMSGKSTDECLSLSASYKLGNYGTEVVDKSRAVMSPYYPQGTPQHTILDWLFTIPSNKSLQLAFSSKFELTNGSFLSVYVPGANVTYSTTTGPTLKAPADLIINNTNVNASLTVGIYLHTYEQSRSSGVKISYTHLDGGYSSVLGNVRQELQSPAYPAKLTAPYSALWVISVPRNNSKGALQLITAFVIFTPSNGSVLQLRDGANVDSPIFTKNSSQLRLGDPYSVTTSSNYIYVSYKFEQTNVNATGSPFLIDVVMTECANTSQCVGVSNETVCMPPSWKCDGIYQCLDGKDEFNCNVAPTTKAPAVTKKGAAWWVVALCIVGGVVFGVILSVIIITVIMRKRGRGYTRLSELMTPVPT